MDFLEACVVLQWGMDPIKQNHKKMSKIGPKKNSSHFSGPRFWKMSKIAPKKNSSHFSGPRFWEMSKIAPKKKSSHFSGPRFWQMSKIAPNKNSLHFSSSQIPEKVYIYICIYIYIYIYIFMCIYTFSGICELEKCKLFFFGPILDICQNLGPEK